MCSMVASTHLTYVLLALFFNINKSELLSYVSMKYFGLFVSIMTCVDSLGANLGIASFCLFLIIIMAYMCN